MTNYLQIIHQFKKNNSSKFAQETSDECLLIFLDFLLKEQGQINRINNNLCIDDSCYCGKYKKGDLMYNCDGGCMYPGA